MFSVSGQNRRKDVFRVIPAHASACSHKAVRKAEQTSTFNSDTVQNQGGHEESLNNVQTKVNRHQSFYYGGKRSHFEITKPSLDIPLKRESNNILIKMTLPVVTDPVFKTEHLVKHPIH